MENDKQGFVMTSAFLPWTIKEELQLWEAACLLAGKFPSFNHCSGVVDGWISVIDRAIEKGELCRALEQEERWAHNKHVFVSDLREWLKEKNIASGFFSLDQQNNRGVQDCCESEYLDPSHEYYSEELALAVKAWLALYGEGGKYQSNQAHKDQIGALLPKKLSKEAIDRIATLVNPRKKGGAPATGL